MRLHVEEAGAGQGHVLVLHGAPTPPEAMAPLVAALAREHHVLLPHLPGYGKTPASDGAHSLAWVSQWIEEALHDRGIREVAVVGYAAGAWRGLALLASRSVRVRQVAALAGFARLSRQERAGYRQLAALLRAGADLRDSLAARLVGSSQNASDPARADRLERWLEACPQAALAAEMEAFAAAPDLTPILGKCHAPVLALAGALDRVASPAHSRHIAAAVRHGKLVELAGVGHALLEEAPDRVCAELLAFLR